MKITLRYKNFMFSENFNFSILSFGFLSKILKSLYQEARLEEALDLMIGIEIDNNPTFH